MQPRGRRGRGQCFTVLEMGTEIGELADGDGHKVSAALLE